MATITSENRSAWQALADAHKANFPSVGKSVEITGGKKHLHKVGKIVWHGRNKFYETRYKSDAQLHLMDIVGREGFSVKIQPPKGEAFFVPAEYTTVIDASTIKGFWVAGKDAPRYCYSGSFISGYFATSAEKALAIAKRDDKSYHAVIEYDKEAQPVVIYPVRKDDGIPF